MSNKFDVTAARACFPALNQQQVFLDNAGGSQVLGSVIDSIREYLCTSNVQPGASYPIGKATNTHVSDAEAAGARYVNASTEEIVYGASTTQLFRNLSQTLRFKEGDEIIVSQIDHEANIASWIDLAEAQKLVLKWWKPKDLTNPKLLASDLDELLSPKTRLVTCTHASNVLGSIHDIPAISKAVHTVPGALLCVDGVAYAPHRPIDVKAFGVDFYCFSWYKAYGPHCSMLYASANAQQQMKSLGHRFNPTKTLKDKIGLAAGLYELTQSIPEVEKYLSGEEKWQGMIAQEAQVQSILLDYLKSNPIFTIIGESSADPELRVPTVSFNVRGWNSRDFVEAVESQSNYGFRFGAFYSNRLICDLLGMSPDGIVRISMVHYSTVDEVKGVIQAMDKILQTKN